MAGAWQMERGKEPGLGVVGVFVVVGDYAPHSAMRRRRNAFAGSDPVVASAL